MFSNFGNTLAGDGKVKNMFVSTLTKSFENLLGLGFQQLDGMEMKSTETQKQTKS